MGQLFDLGKYLTVPPKQTIMIIPVRFLSNNLWYYQPEAIANVFFRQYGNILIQLWR